MYVKRHLFEAFMKGNKFFPALLLTGPRQVGKTTFLRHISEPERKYVTLDDAELRTLAKEDPHAFLERFNPPVLIDEIQYVPELLSYIKIIVDERRFSDPENANGMFWLTGSQRFSLMKGVSESLAGRIAVFEMAGLSQRELDLRPNEPFTPDRVQADGKAKGTKEIFTRIWTGCFPEVLHADAETRDIFYSSYVNTYLERDVRNLTNVHDLEKFRRFLCSCAARTGQLLNLSELARDASVNAVTAQNWLSLLVSSRIVYLLQPYASSLTARLVKTPKLYFLDTGLCSYLTRWPTPETLEAGAMNGAIFESWCMSEILKTYWNSGVIDPKFFFYRDKDKKEIDLLIDTADGIYPVEIKKTSTPKPEDVKHFSVLEKLKVPIRKGALVCSCSNVVPMPKRNVVTVPVSLI